MEKENAKRHLYVRVVIKEDNGDEYPLMRRLFRRVATNGNTMTATHVDTIEKLSLSS